MGEILVIDTNIMILALKNDTKERGFVEQVLKLCDTIVVSKKIYKEYRTVAGWYHWVGFESIWSGFKNYVCENFGKKILELNESKIKAKKKMLGINNKEDDKLKKMFDRYDYKLIECAIGCCHKKVVIISRDSSLLGRKVSIKDKTILFMTPEDYLQQRCVQ
ncbi:MAG TPA: hypothetical protein EYG86_03880 [Crocinitomicaceae bacterium]|nr:hypothetical protein [Crocinitomicaceae bacterium]